MTTTGNEAGPCDGIGRIVIIDSLRGVALIAMASYHLVWDLEFFGYLEPGTALQAFWKSYARAIAASFLFLAGFSLVLAHFPTVRWHGFARRQAYIAAAALAISVVTFFAMPGAWIHFGILHNIAVSSLIGIGFVTMPPVVTALAIALIAFGVVADNLLWPGLLRSSFFDERWLSWIGFAEAPARSNDYVPLFPWVGALLAGVLAARLLKDRGGLSRLAAMQRRPGLLSLAGRHSLAIYLLHQPLMIAMIYLYSLALPPDPRPGFVYGCQRSCVADIGDSATCERFCTCTADALEAQSLMRPLQSSAINADDPRIVAITEQCSIVAQ